MSTDLPSQLTGQDTSSLCVILSQSSEFRLTPAAAAAFTELREAGREQGFELAIASAHRDFQRQLAIWNAKAAGERPVLDDAGNELDLAELDERGRLFAILRWSALPGMSRHHWGSDIDVYDSAAIEAGYRVQLTPQECVAGGVFGALHQWLDEVIDKGESRGFFRPYRLDHGGVAPEPWHLSYGPEAVQFAQELDLQRSCDFIACQPIALRDAILANFEEIYQRFIASAAEDIR